ncbi:MAG: hypothetical protein SGPRY_003836 [Prymnesium sp.]
MMSFPNVGMCKGKVISQHAYQCPRHHVPGAPRPKACNVQYEIDKIEQDFEEEELRSLLLISHLPER